MPDAGPDDPRACAWCHEPLPPHPGKGRPPTTHPGDCRRLRRNALQLRARIERYLAAAGPVAIDRSDDVHGAIRESAVDRSDLYGDEPTLGNIAEPFNPRHLPGKALMAVIRKHEEQQATAAQMKRQAATVDADVRAKAALVPLIPYDEYREILRRRPGTSPSPAFLAYEARREELDAALGQVLLAMTAPAPRTKRTKAPTAEPPTADTVTD